jgi:hypothetical protein
MILVITYNKTPDFALTFSHREFRLVGYVLKIWPHLAQTHLLGVLSL